MTASGKIFVKVDVTNFVNSNVNVIYEPEIYPGIYWRDEKMCITYYSKGSYVITGVRNRKQKRRIFLKFYSSLQPSIKE